MGRGEGKTEKSFQREELAGNHGDGLPKVKAAIRGAELKWKLSGMARRGSRSQPAVGARAEQDGQRLCSNARPPRVGLWAPRSAESGDPLNQDDMEVICLVLCVPSDLSVL